VLIRDAPSKGHVVFVDPIVAGPAHLVQFISSIELEFRLGAVVAVHTPRTRHERANAS